MEKDLKKSGQYVQDEKQAKGIRKIYAEVTKAMEDSEGEDSDKVLFMKCQAAPRNCKDCEKSW